MELDFKTLLRYGIPGAILLLPLILTSLYNNHAAGSDITILLLVFIMVPLGYIIHQMWILLFELVCSGYRRGRPNLRYIAKELNIGSTDGDAVYLAWEYWIYLKAGEREGVFNRTRRIWQGLYAGLFVPPCAA